MIKWKKKSIVAQLKANTVAIISLVTALTAEAVKLGVIACLLGIVLVVYGEVVVPAFLGSFMATALIFSMAFFVRDKE